MQILPSSAFGFASFDSCVLNLVQLRTKFSSTMDTFITFNRPCEAARQIGDGVLYLWTMPNKDFCKFIFFHADTKTDHKSLIQ
jgi:hypothetical protein